MKNSDLLDLFSYLKKYRLLFVLVFVALSIVALSLLALGGVFKDLVDQGLSSKNSMAINENIFKFSCLIMLFASGSFLRSYLINTISMKIVSQIKLDIFMNLIKINIAKFEELSLGDLLSRLGSDIEIINNFIINFLSFFVRNSIMLLGGCILMFTVSYKLSFVVMICLPILLIPLLFLSRKVKKLARDTLSKNSTISSLAEEVFSGIQTIHSYNQQEFVVNKYNDLIINYQHSAKKRLLLRSLFFALAIVAISFSIIIVIWLGSIYIINGKMTSGEMISFIYYSFMVAMSMGGIAELFGEAQVPLAALNRVFEYKNLPIDHLETIPLEKEVNLGSGISFRDISFAYPSRREIPIFKNFNLEIKAGKLTAIVGSSGSGKSTLLQLLLRLYKEDSGSIEIGGISVDNINLCSLRNHFSYVMQQPVIFTGSIRENIAFSKPEASLEEIEDIAKKFQISEFTNNFIDKLDAQIGQKGMRLSGGQKQRISLARALLKKPEILLLDEATSAIDKSSEEHLLKEIKQLMRGKTTLIIAHRLSSIIDADEIIVIDKNIVINKGDHNYLIKNCAIYQKLFQL